MGRCFHPLQSIPVSGDTKTFLLLSHSGKSKHGFISLSFQIRGVKENIPIEVSNDDYKSRRGHGKAGN